MKASFNRLVILISSLYFSYPLVAQNKTTGLQDSIQASLYNMDSSHLKDSALPKKAAVIADSTTPSYLQLNAVYESNDVYLGRQDSARLPLITPEISYIFSSGFEIDFSVGLSLQGPTPKVNSYVLDVSYTFTPGNYTGAATLTASNYSVGSSSPQAAQKGSLEYDNSYDFGFIEPSLNLSWLFAKTPDYQLVFALQHQYNLFSSVMNITPTATMNASTQNIYNSYYKNKRFSIPRPGKPPLPENVTVSGEVLNSGKFQIMNYELSAPVNYVAGKWTFNFTPTYALPVNAADIRLTTSVNNNTTTRTYKETLPNLFYYQVGVTYAF